LEVDLTVLQPRQRGHGKKNPLYPFDISTAVADKLGFVHMVVVEVSR